MPNQTIASEPKKLEAPSKPAAPRKSRGIILLVVGLVVVVLMIPVIVATAIGAYLLTRSSPLPKAHLVELPETQHGEETAAGEEKSPQREYEHPLDEALEIAYSGLEHMRKNVNDYTATLVSRDRISGKLKDEQTMLIKIRSPKTEDEKLVVPLSVYLKFLEPKKLAGREVIYVAGQNENKIVGHETGFLNVARYYLRPEGPIAMLGERYPITEIGVERLTEQLIERGEEERLLDPKKTNVEVTVEKGYEFIGRKCTRIRVRYPEQTPDVEFHSAEICIDEELIVPIYYVAYSWPPAGGGEPLLEEEYTYKDVKVNVGLTDSDFDPNNKEYKFP